MVHSVTNVTQMKVSPTAEKVKRRTNAIRNPNPPISIMFTSRTTSKYDDILMDGYILNDSKIYSDKGKFLE